MPGVLEDGVDPKSIRVNSSMSTIWSLVNSMVGGTMLLFPSMCIQSGFITAAVIMSISCLISYKTCAIFTIHMKDNEIDIQWPIKRILGNGWYMFFVIICTIYLLFLSVLYYVLIIQMLYSLIAFILYKSHVNPDHYVPVDDAETTVTLNKFSEQWVMIATFFPILGMLFMKKLTILVKIASVGVYAIYSYLIFIFYAFANNIYDHRVHSEYQDIEMWTWNIGNLGGTASLAFTIHTSFGNMIKCNKNQSKNVRDLGISYAIGYFVYMVIGIFGGLGIINRKEVEAKNLPSLVTEYFGPGNFGPFFVQLLYFGHLVSVLPIFFDIMKRRCYPVFLKDKPAPKWLNAAMNVGFMCFSVAIKMIPGIDPDDITNFNGSLCCFFFVYLIPIVMHMTCYHGKNFWLRKVQRKLSRFTVTKPLEYEEGEEGYSPEAEQRLLESGDKLEHTPSEQLDENKEKSDDNSENENEQNEFKKNAKSSTVSCAPHEDIDSTNLVVRLIVYGIILIIGLGILIYGMYTIFDEMINGTDVD